jgi:hypothetical protein
MFQFARRAGLNAAQLLTAFSFFRLRGADLWFFQYVYPTVISAVIFVSYQMLEGEFFAVQLTSIVSSATTLMGVLVGFYIAALAAVTSFPNESLNSIMAGNAPKILERSTGQRMPVTRRRFLAILLGYCAFLLISRISTNSQRPCESSRSSHVVAVLCLDLIKSAGCHHALPPLPDRSHASGLVVTIVR